MAQQNPSKLNIEFETIKGVHELCSDSLLSVSEKLALCHDITTIQTILNFYPTLWIRIYFLVDFTYFPVSSSYNTNMTLHHSVWVSYEFGQDRKWWRARTKQVFPSSTVFTSILAKWDRDNFYADVPCSGHQASKFSLTQKKCWKRCNQAIKQNHFNNFGILEISFRQPLTDVLILTYFNVSKKHERTIPAEFCTAMSKQRSDNSKK